MFESDTENTKKVFKDIITNNDSYESIYFTDCTFLRCDISESRFINCSFDSCFFEKCNLSNAKFINTSFNSCKFEGSKLLGIDFTTCLNRIGLVLDCKKSDLSYSNFAGVDISRSKFISTNLSNCDFSKANCRNVQIGGCDLERALFDMTDLSNATIVSTLNCVFDPRSNRIKGLNISRSSANNLLLVFGIKIVND